MTEQETTRAFTRAFMGTPGEWRRESVPTIYLEELGLECEIVRDKAGEPVAFIPYRFGEYHIVGMANAQAIAAEPELLEALQATLEALGRLHAIGDNHGRPCVACAAGAQANKAIRKALGEPS